MGWNRPILGIFLLAVPALACTTDEAARESASSAEAQEADALEARPPDAPRESLSRLRSLGYAAGGPSGAVYVAASLATDFELLEPDGSTERYDFVQEEGFLSPAAHPLSTCSIDVDTASYSNVRRFLESGQLPPAGAVRIEELVNYFRYDADAVSDEGPFAVRTELTQAPWAEGHLLLRIGLRGAEIDERDLPPRNLVFLVDVSGSMEPADKLPLLQRGLRELALHLGPEDHVALVVYAGAAGLVLPPTPGSETGRILDALERLQAGGSTAGAEGIQLAYEVARRHFDPEAINRVLLATDGDFNVGVTSRSELVRLIERERESGVFLSVLGVGRGNLNDAGMEELADHGNGNYAYLDGPAEARKVLVREAGGTLVTIAKDVKLQLEFNPWRVAAYRLIGYENRRLADRDFNDDRKDAGEIGAGHSVTAFYEIVPVGAAADTGDVDPLVYQRPGHLAGEAASDEWLTLKLRFKLPDADTSRLLTRVVAGPPWPFESASDDVRFGAAVALFGMLLRDSEYVGEADWTLVQELARSALGDDPSGDRAGFLELAARARDLDSDLRELPRRGIEVGASDVLQ
jgi:Ca-activated chloride channel family protein